MERLSGGCSDMLLLNTLNWSLEVLTVIDGLSTVEEKLNLDYDWFESHKTNLTFNYLALE